jgi:hypothetical protein
MKALRTIVATAAIVLALTTVAMAGAQHFTTRDGPAGAHAQAAQSTCSITLTAAHLAPLMNGGAAVSSSGTQYQGRSSQYHAKAARHQTSRRHAGEATHAQASGSGGTRRHEPTRRAGRAGPIDRSRHSHHAEMSHSAGVANGGGSRRD